MKRKAREKRKAVSKRTVMLVLAVVVALLGIAGFILGKDALALLHYEKELKSQIKTTASCLLSGDSDGAEKSVAELELTLAKTNSILSGAPWMAAEKMPFVGHDISTVRGLLAIAQEASDNILKPTVEVMGDYPLKQKDDHGVSLSSVTEYISLAEQILPDAKRCVDEIQQLPPMRITRLEKKLTEIRMLADMADSLLPPVDAILAPLAATLRENPLPENMNLSLGGLKSIDKQSFDAYLALAQEILPHLRECLSQLHTVMTDNGTALDSLSPELKEKLLSLDTLVSLGEDALQELAPSAISVLKNNPLAELLPGEAKINVILLSNYLDYAQQIMPALKEYDQRFRDAEPGFDESVKNKLLPFSEKLEKVIALYDRGEPYLPLIRTVIGSGEDRLYLFAAQNSAEIRAAGGFPGSIGTIEIKNGVLSVGDFLSVYQVLPGYTEITELEAKLFTTRVRHYRDAEFNPYFPRVSQMWADSYEERTSKHVDGVISLTPAIIQNILGVTGGITLSDGTRLDGTNATWVLQSGLYKHYQQSGDSNNNDLADALFAETAKRSLKQVFSQIDLTKLDAYISVFEKSRDERVLMMWMSDGDEQRIVEQAGCDGGFNRDPAKPQIGIFFNNYVSSKLGWYFDMDIHIGTGVKNMDGSYSYPVEVSIANTLDREERSSTGNYIVGGEYGAMVGSMYFVASANGSLSEFESNASAVWIENYMGADIACADYIHLPIDTAVTFSFTATTAPGEQEPLTVTHTPTLQEYRTEDCEYGIAETPVSDPG